LSRDSDQEAPSRPVSCQINVGPGSLQLNIYHAKQGAPDLAAHRELPVMGAVRAEAWSVDSCQLAYVGHCEYRGFGVHLLWEIQFLQARRIDSSDPPPNNKHSRHVFLKRLPTFTHDPEIQWM